MYLTLVDPQNLYVGVYTRPRHASQRAGRHARQGF